MRKPSARGANNREIEEFAERYETLSIIFGDPVEVLFGIMASSRPEVTMELRGNVAEKLMSYRYAKLKALENKGGDAQGVTININNVPMAPQMTFTVKSEEDEAIPASRALVRVTRLTGLEDMLGDE